MYLRWLIYDTYGSGGSLSVLIAKVGVDVLTVEGTTKGQKINLKKDKAISNESKKAIYRKREVEKIKKSEKRKGKDQKKEVEKHSCRSYFLLISSFCVQVCILKYGKIIHTRFVISIPAEGHWWLNLVSMQYISFVIMAQMMCNLYLKLASSRLIFILLCSTSLLIHPLQNISQIVYYKFPDLLIHLNLLFAQCSKCLQVCSLYLFGHDGILYRWCPKRIVCLLQNIGVLYLNLRRKWVKILSEHFDYMLILMSIHLKITHRWRKGRVSYMHSASFYRQLLCSAS